MYFIVLFNLKLHLKQKLYLFFSIFRVYRILNVKDFFYFQLTHSEDRPYECAVCLKKFKTERTMRLHLQHHLDMKNETFRCSSCNKIFVSKRSLARHKAAHHRYWKRYSCKHCKKKYMFKSLLDRHIKVSCTKICCSNYLCI